MEEVLRVLAPHGVAWIGIPKHVQWIGYPKFARSHEQLASVSAMVSAQGRLFCIVFDGMIAARGRVFLSLEDGSLVCFGP